MPASFRTTLRTVHMYYVEVLLWRREEPNDGKKSTQNQARNSINSINRRVMLMMLLFHQNDQLNK